jgi:hypothetical protein
MRGWVLIYVIGKERKEKDDEVSACMYIIIK